MEEDGDFERNNKAVASGPFSVYLYFIRDNRLKLVITYRGSSNQEVGKDYEAHY